MSNGIALSFEKNSVRVEIVIDVTASTSYRYRLETKSRGGMSGTFEGFDSKESAFVSAADSVLDVLHIVRHEVREADLADLKKWLIKCREFLGDQS